MKKCSLNECKAMLARDKEVQRACAVGRTREADAQMKIYVQAFKSVLKKVALCTARQCAKEAFFAPP